ncbi:MAG TPA: hypothetical protein VIY48_13055 [Candidatus Paceibacterota bacterium]
MTDKLTLPLNPEEIEKLNPAEYAEFIVRLAQALPADILDSEYRNQLRKIAAANDGMDSYLAYYELIHGGAMVEHNLPAIKAEYEAWDSGQAFLWFGFRGCRKTSTQFTLASFLHGHHPDETGVITGANDGNSKLIAKSIAQIIELHPEFKATFPHVEINKSRGWGAEGYWLRDTRMTPEEWAAKMANVNDPSFIGGGYRSSEINGKHPSLYLFVDDLHDIDSSASVTEREAIKTVFFAQILKTAIRKNDKLKTRVSLTGVPFASDDTYHVMKNSGDVVFFNLPVMTRAAPKAPGAVFIDGIHPVTGAIFDDIKGWWYLTWADSWGIKSIISERAKGKSSFWQMMMLDINTAKTAGFTYYLFPRASVRYDWITAGGADPTNVVKDKEVGGNKRSNFALCYLSKLPNNTLLVVDGFLKQVGIVEAKDAILQAQTMFPRWRTTGVENVGGGAVFIQYLRTDSAVRVQDSGLTLNGKGKVKSKPDRINLELSPWVESGVIQISDASTPFLDALRRLFDKFFDLAPDDPAWDAGDSLYHAVKLFPEVLRVERQESMNPGEMYSQAHRGLYHPMAHSGGSDDVRRPY